MTAQIHGTTDPYLHMTGSEVVPNVPLKAVDQVVGIEAVVTEPAVSEAPVTARQDRYYHLKFKGQDNQELAEEAWRIHAQGYLAMGFVKTGAVTPEGFLTTDIDKARGDEVDYFLALNPNQETDCATMRKINLVPGEDFRDLPAFKITSDKLSPTGIDLLSHLQVDDYQIKELGALARTPNSNPIAIHEIFRSALHDSLGKKEAWFFSIVSSTFDSLAKSFGPDNFVVIGEDTPIDDPRVSEQVVLRPAILFPDRFIDTLLISYLATDDPKTKHGLLRSFLFFTDGVPEDRISELSAQARQELLTSQANKSSTKQGA